MNKNKTGIELIADLKGIQFLTDEAKKEEFDIYGLTTAYHAKHPEWYGSYQLTQAAIALLIRGFVPHDVVTEIPGSWDVEVFKEYLKRPLKERLILAGSLILEELDLMWYLSNWKIQQIWGEELYNAFCDHIDDEGYLHGNWAAILEDNFSNYDESGEMTSKKRRLYSKMYLLNLEYNADESGVRPIQIS